MHRPKPATKATRTPGSATIAKRRLIAALDADRRPAEAPATRHHEAQLLSQLLAAPVAPKRR